MDNIVTAPKSGENSLDKNKEAIISVRQISRTYQLGSSEVHALREVTFDLPQGIMGALKGRSGSGKTTLLNVIGGLDQPTSGEISLFAQSSRVFRTNSSSS